MSHVGDERIAHEFFPRHIKLTSEQSQLILVPLINGVRVAGHVSKPGQGLHLERTGAQRLTESIAATVDELDIGIGVGYLIRPSVSDVDDDTRCSGPMSVDEVQYKPFHLNAPA